jgi:hypothetical protein
MNIDRVFHIQSNILPFKSRLINLSKSSGYFIYAFTSFNIEQGRQCKQNMTLGCVRTSIVALGKE